MDVEGVLLPYFIIVIFWDPFNDNKVPCVGGLGVALGVPFSRYFPTPLHHTTL